MPHVRVNGTSLHYVEAGPADAPPVVLSHSFLVDHRQYDAQIEMLAAHFRVIAYDHRDHGRSARARTDYTIDVLTTDAVELVRTLGAAPCHWVGLSTGGFVGLRIALRFPELLRRLVLMDTSATGESAYHRTRYGALLWVLRNVGVRAVTGAGMKAMFGPTFLRDPAFARQREVWRDRIRDVDPHAMSRFGRAIFTRPDLSAELDRIDIPTLVLVGEDDRPQPPSRARALAAGIPGARLRTIPGAGHLSTVEQPALVNAALRDFLVDGDD